MPDDRHLQEGKYKESRKRGFVVRNNVKGLNLRPERQVAQQRSVLCRLWAYQVIGKH